MRVRLISIRKEKKLSQQTVANAIGIGRSAYAMIESGKRNPSYVTLLSIKRFFHLDDDSAFIDITDSIVPDDKENELECEYTNA